MKIDRLLSALIVTISLATLISTRGFPLEAAIYPRSILILLIAFGSFLFIKPRCHKVVTMKSILSGVRSGWQVIVVAVLSVLFAASIKTIGFFVGLFIYLIVVPVILGERGIRNLVVPAIVITTIIYVVFITVLRINIPVAFWLMA